MSTTETYTLDGPIDFYFPHPVRTASQLTVEVVPGGVLPTSSYQVIGAGPTATGITVRYESAPTDGESELRISRYVPPERVTYFEDDKGVPAVALNAEFDNIYEALEDFISSYETIAEGVRGVGEDLVSTLKEYDGTATEFWLTEDAVLDEDLSGSYDLSDITLVLTPGVTVTCDTDQTIDFLIIQKQGSVFDENGHSVTYNNRLVTGYGTEDNDTPQNSDLGSAAYLNTGTGGGEVTTNDIVDDIVESAVSSHASETETHGAPSGERLLHTGDIGSVEEPSTLIWSDENTSDEYNIIIVNGILMLQER